IERLEKEVFGPVLHVLRFARSGLDALLQRINATGYGLTMGVHSRIDETIERVAARAQVGNLYVNRNMVGALVGVQPFGGEGLSGTGPKAGGPLYLYRLLAQRPVSTPLPPQADAADEDAPRAWPALQALAAWSRAQQRGDAALCERFAAASVAGVRRVLPGPTGERNVYRLEGRHAVLCLADDERDRLAQLAGVLAVGSRALWPESPEARALHAALPSEVQPRVGFTPDWQSSEATAFDAVLHHGSPGALRAVCEALAARPGAIVGVQGLADAAIVLDRLLLERSLSVNTAAAGGNAHLMTIG
ncbi:MAG: trifunctional transcriptional regulator/proline dehydrogenase/L-glutamate gamma-semialdehyde dehydrogenase, partial [Variovorax paradoxus]